MSSFCRSPPSRDGRDHRGARLSRASWGASPASPGNLARDAATDPGDHPPAGHGSPTTTLTEYTEQGSREVDLPARDAYAAVIDHVLACCQGRETSRLSPASVLDTLQLTLDVRSALAAPKRP
jgi:hypothetical protein